MKITFKPRWKTISCQLLLVFMLIIPIFTPKNRVWAAPLPSDDAIAASNLCSETGNPIFLISTTSGDDYTKCAWGIYEESTLLDGVMVSLGGGSFLQVGVESRYNDVNLIVKDQFDTTIAIERAYFPPSSISTFTFTPAPTSILTFTPSPTSTFTFTPGPTSTFTFTPGPTSTFTFTPSPTSTFTFTPSPTSTFTFTPSPTSTFTFTPSPTSTFTFTPSPTSTFTFTPSPTSTFTFTPSPTSTFTFTPSPTSTFTPTPTRTFTAVVEDTTGPEESSTPDASQLRMSAPVFVTATRAASPTLTPSLVILKATSTNNLPQSNTLISATSSITPTVIQTSAKNPGDTAGSTLIWPVLGVGSLLAGASAFVVYSRKKRN